VTLVIQAGVKVLFLANSDDQSSGQRLSDSELLVKGTLSVIGHGRCAGGAEQQ